MSLNGIQLIGVHGNARTGKDTVAYYLCKHYENTYKVALADHLKECCSVAFGIDEKHFYEDDLKEKENSFWGMSPRKMAQYVGTEMFRTHLGPNFWVKRMEGLLTGEARLSSEGDYCAGDTVVIPDVRFQNEYDWIIKNGGIVIVLTRKGADGNVGIVGHPSEAGIHLNANDPYFKIENDGTIEDLYKEVDSIIPNQPFIQLTPKETQNV